MIVSNKYFSLNLQKEHPTSTFVKSYKHFARFYGNWRIEVNAEEALKSKHPWQQFQENYPQTVQHSKVVIREPKKFYKRNRKFVPPYKAKL